MNRVITSGYSKSILYETEYDDSEYELTSDEVDEFIRYILTEKYKLNSVKHKLLIKELTSNDEFEKNVFEEFEDEAVEYFSDRAFNDYNTSTCAELEDDGLANVHDYKL